MGIIGDYTNPYLLLFTIAIVSLPFFFPHFCWCMYHTSGRDSRALVRYLRLRYRMWRSSSRNVGLPSVFQDVVARHPEKVAIFFEDEKWTFRELDEYSNRVANYFKGEGLKHGECVAIFMENRMEYVGIWLGLSKIGVVPALLNYNLRSKSLAHCIKIVDAKKIVCASQDQTVIADVLSDDLKLYIHGVSTEKPISIAGAIDLDPYIKSMSSETPPEINDVKFRDKLLYIYTSGTTGLPKAAVIKHSRAMFTAVGATCMMGFTTSDVVYTSLPLYHMATGIMGIGQALYSGNSVVLRRKFSTTQFWNDCIKHRVTVAQYIGEICRYLLNTPEKPTDTKHQVRLMFGNGLRSQIWPQFQSRFKIGRISEFYGSTEGNANIINMDGHQGAVGFLSVVLPSFYPCTLIKMAEDGIPLRDKNGLCIRCQPGEPGEFVGRIITNDPVRDFHGYADKKATASKIVENVWKRGDKAFLSGDILVMDDYGYLYFKDRRGDTFRWRGENVSTTEVENVVSSLVDKRDVVVFGVEIPGSEGRCGMACIMDPSNEVSIPSISTGVIKELPGYARPLFVRRLSELDMTGTFKVKKSDLKKEGYDPTKIKDELFFLDSATSNYIPLTSKLYEDICEGRTRL